MSTEQEQKPVAVEAATPDVAPEAAPQRESETPSPTTVPANQAPASEEAKPELPPKLEPPAPAVPETPLTKLASRLSEITAKVGHKEMWGVELSNIDDHVPTKVVLQKFLRANNKDVSSAEKQLTAALEWRKKMNPTDLVNQVFDEKKFKDLGFVTTHPTTDGKEVIITWNIYGAVKDNKSTFGNVEEFIKWRAAIMELSVQKLNLAEVTAPIPDDGDDPYQMIQVHDYMNVSFFRMDPSIRAASKETISVFSMAYPELLAHKYFVNVPAIMGWMFGAMKLFLAPATLKKFHPMTSGTSLANELKSIVQTLPKDYGGQGPSVKEGLTVALAPAPQSDNAPPTPPKDEPVQPAETTAAPVAVPPAVETTTDTPTEETKVAEEAKPVEQTLPIREEKPAEEAQPTTEETKPVESAKLEPVPETSEAAKEAATTDVESSEKKADA